MVFGPEQALSLSVSAEYLKKFSLLGLPNLQRFTSSGHVLYSGSLFNYTLVPLLVLFRNDPYPITILNAGLLLATGAVLWWVTKYIRDEKTAFLTTFLFIFNCFIIYHSTFIWILNYLPLVGALSILFLTKFRHHLLAPLVLGILAGVGFNLQYLFLPTALLVFIYLLLTTKKRVQTAGLFLLGAVLGNLPMVIFDLKNQGYHLQTLLTYIKETSFSPGQSKISYYHFLHLWPAFALVGAIALTKIFARSRYIAAAILIAYLTLNLLSPYVNFFGPVGMPKGMTYQNYVDAAQVIAQNQPSNFNVTSLLENDSARSYPLRYLLTYRFGLTPLGVEAYQAADSLYALARSNDLKTNTQYETSFFDTKNPIELSKIGEIGIYKLKRIKSKE
jgi:hypothetical protein